MCPPYVRPRTAVEISTATSSASLLERRRLMRGLKGRWWRRSHLYGAESLYGADPICACVRSKPVASRVLLRTPRGDTSSRLRKSSPLVVLLADLQSDFVPYHSQIGLRAGSL